MTPRRVLKPISRFTSFARRAREDHGAAMLEFALVSLVFFTVVFGIMEYGRMILNYNVVSTAAREGVRYASVRGANSGHTATASDIQSYVADHSLGVLTPANVTVTWSPNNKPGSTVQVQTQIFFTPMVPLLPQSTLTLRSASMMVITR